MAYHWCLLVRFTCQRDDDFELWHRFVIKGLHQSNSSSVSYNTQMITTDTVAHPGTLGIFTTQSVYLDAKEQLNTSRKLVSKHVTYNCSHRCILRKREPNHISARKKFWGKVHTNTKWASITFGIHSIKQTLAVC